MSKAWGPRALGHQNFYQVEIFSKTGYFQHPPEKYIFILQQIRKKQSHLFLFPPSFRQTNSQKPINEEK